jgi:hypothetical protein
MSHKHSETWTQRRQVQQSGDCSAMISFLASSLRSQYPGIHHPRIHHPSIPASKHRSQHRGGCVLTLPEPQPFIPPSQHTTIPQYKQQSIPPSEHTITPSYNHPSIQASEQPNIQPSHHTTIPPSHHPTIQPSHHPTIPPYNHAHRALLQDSRRAHRSSLLPQGGSTLGTGLQPTQQGALPAGGRAILLHLNLFILLNLHLVDVFLSQSPLHTLFLSFTLILHPLSSILYPLSSILYPLSSILYPLSSSEGAKRQSLRSIRPPTPIPPQCPHLHPLLH